MGIAIQIQSILESASCRQFCYESRTFLPANVLVRMDFPAQLRADAAPSVGRHPSQ
jgi:hypothetical protein